MIMSENNNKYLNFYFYKHVAFLIVFIFIKELAPSAIGHTIFD